MSALGDLAVLAVAAFAGGALGASVGALQAFSLAGLLIVVGEVSNVTRRSVAATGDLGALGSTGLTASLGLGPGFGPHVAFGGGVAALAYATRRGYVDTGFDYHEAKNVAHALGTRPDVLLVGGVFGVVGLLLTRLSVALSLPWDPIAASIVASAFLHRLAFGYPALGSAPEGRLDMSPFERRERREPVADGGATPAEESGVDPAELATAERRLLVEPWLPHQYRWGNVAALGAVVGVFSAFVAYETGSPFLAFGLTAASLVFLELGMEQFPVTHHMALPASIVVVGLAGANTPAAIQAALPLWRALLAGALLGCVTGLAGELAQRLLYAHADTHLDPPAAAIVVGTFLVAVLDLLGVVQQSLIPTPF